MSSGYARRSVAGAEALALPEVIDWLSDLLASGRTLHGWASSESGGDTFSGRGTVHAAPAPMRGPDDRDRWAVRHYRRGGAIARALGDRYLAVGRVRPVAEAAASAAARARGVPTPAVVAAAWYPGGLFYRADIATELVPDASSLAEVLFDGPLTRPGGGSNERGGGSRDASAAGPAADSGGGPAAESNARRAALGAAGRLVRRLAGRGLRHADLNAMNILLPTDRRGDEDAWVVDLDRARIGADRPVDPGPMLARLERSLTKLGTDRGRPLDPAEWSALRDGVHGP